MVSSIEILEGDRHFDKFVGSWLVLLIYFVHLLLSMNFTTKIPISPVAEDNQLSYATPVVSMGSCFAAHMQEKFAYYKLPFFSHPFGTLFHPLAIERSLERACLGQLFTEEDFFLEEDLWLSFDLHSQWANPSLPTLLEHLNQEVKEVGEALSKASFLILTLGTAWVYEHLATGNIVANCHKQPQKIFSKQLLSAQQIQASLEHIVALVRERQPQIKVIFTLSPVRHLRDGAVENQLSKSLLLCAIHALLGTCTSQKAEGLFYFPSYEILMDELRDYRFYKEDMLHPTEQAVQYVWERFVETFFTAEAQSLMQEVGSIQRALAHRPFNPEGEKHLQFLAALQEKIKKMEEKISKRSE